jgi:hypothetical protein
VALYTSCACGDITKNVSDLCVYVHSSMRGCVVACTPYRGNTTVLASKATL